MSWDDENFNPWDLGADDDGDNQGGDGREDREEMFGAQHVLVLIDCRPSMFEKTISLENDEKISPMQASLQACETLLRNKVKHVAIHKTGKRDGIGIVLYGIPHANKFTFSLLDLQAPGIEQIQTIRSYVNGKVDVKEKAGIQDGKAEWSLRRGLQEADKVINTAKCVKKRTASDKALPDGKSVWIFTNDDNPLADDTEPDKVEKAAGDLVENGVDIHVWPMKTPFNADFYDSILTEPVETQQDMFDVEELMDQIKREFKKTRVSNKIPMLLPNWRARPDDPGIMIDVFRPLQVQKRPLHLTVHQEKKRETVRVTTIVDETTGETLYSSKDSKDDATNKKTSQLATYALFGGRRVPITKDEVAQIKNHSNADREKASLILLGFKPLSSLPLHCTLSQSFYFYPNDEKVKGSTAAFANLHDAMIRKKVFAIGELLLRVTATCRLVAIYPQEEKYDEAGDLEVPQCMVACVLPFEEDVRGLDPDSGTTTEETVQAATNLVTAMTLGDNFSLDYFRNDSLLHFYTYMESIALGTTLPTPEQSLNQISEEDVRATAGEQIDAFLKSLPKDIVVEKEKKRKREPDESGCDWHQLYTTNAIADCTVPMLKSYLRANGERLSGNKAALVERVSLSIGARIAKGELLQV